jgi:D-apiose dehydrogenase
MLTMTKRRFALLGTGFWSTFQLNGWLETGEVECVALYNRTRERALKVAAQFGIPETSVYDDPAELFAREQLDFVDICTAVETHYSLTALAAKHQLPVVCQKPMATTLEECYALVEACKSTGVPLFINENWRWQTPIRQLKSVLDSGRIGRVFRAHIDFRNSFPVFDNQPFLKELDQFILTDIGSHILDVARFLFGEAETVYCQTQRIHQDIRGEDVATVMLGMSSGATVVCDMSYATPREHDRFPETYIEVEGDAGFLELGPDYWIRETRDGVTTAAWHNRQCTGEPGPCAPGK